MCTFLSSQVMMVVVVQVLHFENFNYWQIGIEVYSSLNGIGMRRIFTERSCHMALWMASLTLVGSIFLSLSNEGTFKWCITWTIYVAFLQLLWWSYLFFVHLLILRIICCNGLKCFTSYDCHQMVAWNKYMYLQRNTMMLLGKGSFSQSLFTLYWYVTVR